MKDKNYYQNLANQLNRIAKEHKTINKSSDSLILYESANNLMKISKMVELYVPFQNLIFNTLESSEEFKNIIKNIATEMIEQDRWKHET